MNVDRFFLMSAVALVAATPESSRCQELIESHCTVGSGGSCSNDNLSITFATGDLTPDGLVEVTGSNVYVDDEFAPGDEITSVVRLDTRAPAVQGWSFAVRHDEAVLSIVDDDISFVGTDAEASFGTFPYTRNAVVAGGFFSAVALSVAGDGSILPVQHNTLVTATYVVRVDPGPIGTQLRLASGEIGFPGSPNVEIVVTYLGISLYPRWLTHGLIRNSEDFPLAVTISGGQLPGDCNSDGSLDIADGICILNAALGGGALPCGSGAMDDGSNVWLLDLDGGQALNIHDGVSVLTYLFAGGPPHVLGELCVSIEGCPDGPSC